MNPANAANASDLQTHQMYYNILVGAHLPAILFIAIVAAFTYINHLAPAVPWVLVITGGILLIVSAFPSAPFGAKGRRFSDYAPPMVTVVALVLGIVLGQINVINMEAYVHAKFLNSYSNLLPDTDPLTVSDAGKISFSLGTFLDQQSGAGFQAWPNTYCAAPILAGANGTLATNTSSQSTVGFWAVGMNCCGPRGTFNCNDANVPHTRGGLRVSSHPMGYAAGHDVNAYYLQAIKMSAASYGLTVASDPVMVMWLQSPDTEADWRYKAATIVFLSAVFFAIASCGVLTLFLVTEGRLTRTD